jgi:uncharacterized protein YoaH (UPF0181 family)
MLVFRRGEWHTVQLPDYVDPSWGFGDRQKASCLLHELMCRGLSFHEAWDAVEKEIYVSLGVLGKEHGSPKYEKKDKGVKEET